MNDLKKLRWRCRRGTLELDLMLIRYLDRRFSSAEPQEQQAFLNLLELEDSDLMRYLMGEQVPENSELKTIVMRIRALPATLCSVEESATV